MEIFLYESGKIDYECTYVQGAKNGKSTYYYAHGSKLRQESYEKDRLDGKSLMWGPKENLLSVRNFRNGLPHGKVIDYDDDGKKISESIFKNGERIK